MAARMMAVGLALALTACASQTTTETASAPRQCFWGSQVTGFTPTAADRVVVHVGTRESWELTLSAGCPDVDWAMRIGIVSRGGDRICTGTPAELVVPEASGRGGRRCLVNTVRKLSPDEAAAVRGNTPRQ